MDDKVNLAEKLALLPGPFKPGIVGYLNDYKLAVVKAHGEFVWHKHDETDDFFLVLAGRLTIQLRDRDVELGPGETVFIPRGTVHGFDNRGAAPATCLCVLTPGVLGPAYFCELGALIAAGSPDPEAMGEVMRRHGLVPVV